jgi:arginase
MQDRNNMNTVLNLFIPQWQDSGSTKELYEGAHALKKYIEEKKLIFSEIPISLSPNIQIENNIIGYSTIKAQLYEIARILEKNRPGKIFSIGGGCGIEIPLVSYLSEKYNNLDVIWFDAHGDLNTPDSSPSKYFHGMPLRFLLDDIPNNEISESYKKISCDDVVLIGARELDPAESEFIINNKLKIVAVNNVELENNKIVRQCLNSKNDKVYLHIDLDVLDPKAYANVKCPTENGLTIEQLINIISIIKSEKTIIGISLLENTEKELDQISKIEELIEIGINL